MSKPKPQIFGIGAPLSRLSSHQTGTQLYLLLQELPLTPDKPRLSTLFVKTELTCHGFKIGLMILLMITLPITLPITPPITPLITPPKTVTLLIILQLQLQILEAPLT